MCVLLASFAISRSTLPVKRSAQSCTWQQNNGRRTPGQQQWRQTSRLSGDEIRWSFSHNSNWYIGGLCGPFGQQHIDITETSWSPVRNWLASPQLRSLQFFFGGVSFGSPLHFSNISRSTKIPVVRDESFKAMCRKSLQRSWCRAGGWSINIRCPSCETHRGGRGSIQYHQTLYLTSKSSNQIRPHHMEKHDDT